MFLLSYDQEYCTYSKRTRKKIDKQKTSRNMGIGESLLHTIF